MLQASWNLGRFLDNKVARTFAIGDIHGRATALKEVLSLCDFNYKEDKLIVLGDIVDGGLQTYECVEELLKIKNIIYIIGNHDQWFINYMLKGLAPPIWLNQGGEATLYSYMKNNKGKIPTAHKKFFLKGKYFYIGDKDLFVHAGYLPDLGIENTPIQELIWDRTLINKCRSGLKTPEYKRIFIGHTTTQLMTKDKSTLPQKFNQLWMLDTGGGWNGRLTIMNVDTEEYWQSSQQKPEIISRA